MERIENFWLYTGRLIDAQARGTDTPQQHLQHLEDQRKYAIMKYLQGDLSYQDVLSIYRQTSAQRRTLLAQPRPRI